MTKDSFIFFRSFSETASLIPDEHERLMLFEGLVRYGLEGEMPELPYPLNAILIQMVASVNAANERYEKAVSDGQKGGRPKKWIPPEEWQAYRKDHSQRETADHFGISVDTLRRWEKAAKPQNLNDNVTVNVNDNVTDNENVNDNDNDNSHYQINNKKTTKNASPPPAPDGASAPLPLMPGYEFDRPDGRYRINEEGRAIRIADKPK